MTVPTSQVSVGIIDVSGLASLGLQVSYENFGDTYLTMADGSLQHQAFFQKTRFTVTARGVVPSALRAIDRSSTYTVVLPDPEEVGDTRTYTGMYVTALSETHDVNTAQVSWSMTCEAAAAP